MTQTERLRCLALIICAALAVAGGALHLDLIGGHAVSFLDWARTIVFTVVLFWLVWGGFVGVLGALSYPHHATRSLRRPMGRTAILVPVYNEDPYETFARIAAMNRQVVDRGLADRFHFAILSDTTAPEVAAQEASCFELLVREPESAGRIFYRRREQNVGRKAGNIEDFIARSGGAYDYALILDADSLMEASTIVAMANRFDEDERLGLLQTVPEVIGAKTLFGRMMAFSSAYFSPYFARGVALLQGEEGPYWGHNAMVRVRAFAACCGLPVLSGKPPTGGHILSHDYVEAALLARGGWKVEVDPTLHHSFENGPENLIAYAKRDRRWCQGNLQHRRLVMAPRLRLWSRFTFIQGIMAYLVSPLWLMLLLTSLAAAAFADRIDARAASAAWMLIAAIGGALLLPKVAIVARGMFDGQNRRFGGTAHVVLSVLAEIVLSTVVAPVLLAFQSRSVFQILFGLDGGWPATARDERRVSLAASVSAGWWISLLGIGATLFAALYVPGYLPWLLPVAAPAMAAPLIIWLTSFGGSGVLDRLVFTTATERETSAIILDNNTIVESWLGQVTVPVLEPIAEATHAPA